MRNIWTQTDYSTPKQHTFAPGEGIRIVRPSRRAVPASPSLAAVCVQQPSRLAYYRYWQDDVCSSASTTASENDSRVDDPAPAGSVALLNFLRQHGAYLTPGHGITLTSAIAVVLRGIFLNLAIWTLILIAVMLALLAMSGFDALQWIAGAFGFIFVFGSLVYSFPTHARRNVRKQRYVPHRLYETHMPWILWPMLGAGTLASLPWAADASFGWIGRFGGATFVVVGLGVGLCSFLRPDSSWGVSLVRKRALPLGALTALYVCCCLPTRVRCGCT